MSTPVFPYPVGATQVHEWELATDSADRYFVGPAREVGTDFNAYIEVLTDGVQHSDGRVDRSITVIESGIERFSIPPGLARELGDALIAAADLAERAGATDPDGGKPVLLDD